MAIGIDDLDDDDLMEQGGEQPLNEPSNEPSLESNSNEGDFMTDFLRSKGIEDPSKIKFEEQDGSIVERNWDSLSREEQFNILNTPQYDPVENTDQFDEEEIALLNSIRLSGLTPSQYIGLLQALAVPQEPMYQVDQLSDDELYILDLESRVGELSEDEAAQALAVAKQNEDFFNKQISGIRREYKQNEEFRNQQEQAQFEQQRQELFEQYQAQIVNAIDGFSSVGNLDLTFEDADKEELAEFMLAQDETGQNYLYKALQDPQTLVKAAWFILNGDEAFNNVSDYFKNLIKLVSENQYKKGYEDAKNGLQSRRPQVVIKQNNNINNRHHLYNSIDDLDDED